MVSSVKSFEDLECWKSCRGLRQLGKKLLVSFPNDEKYRLTDQITRALRSTTYNIAEGYGRFHYQENIQFCRISRGSLHELIDHFIIAREENFISETNYKEIKIQIDKCLAILNGYINYLHKAKNR
ncbi:four helix bundle protein [Fulvivirga sp. RKSG066]|uniref:four helix bundle protein n=1 Tax=Fulvivirga aurantia TaxID=2529383 RepID=UPI0012BD117A|nr:four helix bundle protein [Fulvivirga aurantia]MTI20071.1 four helix bundle protein [Fulvivirga aurantia]